MRANRGRRPAPPSTSEADRRLPRFLVWYVVGNWISQWARERSCVLCYTGDEVLPFRVEGRTFHALPVGLLERAH